MTDLPFMQLILHASLLVQMVMLLLFCISMYSWALIIYKSRVLKRAKKDIVQFEENFWKGKDLSALYNRITSSNKKPTGLESIFVMGYVEFTRLRKYPNITPTDVVEGTERAMQVAFHREMEQLDRGLPVLATIGSVSPYIGLFGTVWGIMNSFHALASVQQVTLSMVAPGISEALIATAMGLFAAIPAVMAYNNYVDEIDRLGTHYDIFLDEFAGFLQRQIHSATTIS